MPKTPGLPIFQLRITLERVEPQVWRRVLVPGGVRLNKLHDMIQAAMGWTNSHLHCFDVGGTRYGMQFDDYPDDELDETEFTVVTAIGGVRNFAYEYDFGDSWDHHIVVEQFAWHAYGLKHAVCLDGQHACPPEDVGGSSGYAEFLTAIRDLGHPEHDHYLAWAGGAFDPVAFDIAAANVALQRVR